VTAASTNRGAAAHEAHHLSPLTWVTRGWLRSRDHLLVHGLLQQIYVERALTGKDGGTEFHNGEELLLCHRYMLQPIGALEVLGAIGHTFGEVAFHFIQLRRYCILMAMHHCASGWEENRHIAQRNQGKQRQR
jgi:hypothetical protein